MIQENTELELRGKGVEPTRIPSLDKLVRQYVLEKEKVDEAAKHEEDAAEKLVDAMHEHAEQLRQPDGALIYKCGTTVVSLVTGNEKLKVKKGASKDGADN